MPRIEQFYSELYGSDHAVTIQTEPQRSTANNPMGSGSTAEKNEKWESSGKRSQEIEPLRNDESVKKWKEVTMVIFVQST